MEYEAGDELFRVERAEEDDFDRYECIANNTEGISTTPLVLFLHSEYPSAYACV